MKEALLKRLGTVLKISYLLSILFGLWWLESNNSLLSGAPLARVTFSEPRVIWLLFVLATIVVAFVSWIYRHDIAAKEPQVLLEVDCFAILVDRIGSLFWLPLYLLLITAGLLIVLAFVAPADIIGELVGLVVFSFSGIVTPFLSLGPWVITAVSQTVWMKVVMYVLVFSFNILLFSSLYRYLLSKTVLSIPVGVRMDIYQNRLASKMDALDSMATDLRKQNDQEEYVDEVVDFFQSSLIVANTEMMLRSRSRVGKISRFSVVFGLMIRSRNSRERKRLKGLAQVVLSSVGSAEFPLSFVRALELMAGNRVGSSETMVENIERVTFIGTYVGDLVDQVGHILELR